MQFSIDINGIDGAFTAKREAIVLTFFDIEFGFESVALFSPNAGETDS